MSIMDKVLDFLRLNEDDDDEYDENEDFNEEFIVQPSGGRAY